MRVAHNRNLPFTLCFLNLRTGPGRKPKWGFLPAPTHLSDETREIKTRTCRFCMHAHLKSTQGENVSLGYCPLDLFARDHSRVTRALHALWDVWIGSGAAVNNLRVFVAGRKLTPTADVRLLSLLLLLLMFGARARERLTLFFTASVSRHVRTPPVLPPRP